MLPRARGVGWQQLLVLVVRLVQHRSLLGDRCDTVKGAGASS
jgi:hypothetical protein